MLASALRRDIAFGALRPDEKLRIDALRQRASREDGTYAVSALSGEGLDAFLEDVTRKLGEEKRREVLGLGYDQGRQRAWQFEKGLVEQEIPEEDGYHLTLHWSASDRARFDSL